MDLNELKNLDSKQMFHIWWHPHNLGSNVNRSFCRLEQILDLISNRARLAQEIAKIIFPKLLEFLK